jgi:hypothetical protein
VTTTFALTSLGLVVLGYLFGSLSPSVFLGRIFKGLDVRERGSGNAGTTNAFRVLGVKLGIAVLLGDVLKGVIPVLIARLVLDDDTQAPLVTVIVALASMVGHNYSLFLRGRGGKGVATGAGAALAMMPVPMAHHPVVDRQDRVCRLDLRHRSLSRHGHRVGPAPAVHCHLLPHVGGCALGPSRQLPPLVETF